MPPQTRSPIIPDFFNADRYKAKQIERGPLALRHGNIYFHEQNISPSLTKTQRKFLTALLILPEGITIKALAKAHEYSTGTPYPHDVEKALNNLKAQKSKITDRLRKDFPDLPVLDIGSFNPVHRRGEKGQNTLKRELAGYFILDIDDFKPRLPFKRVAPDTPRVPVIPECLKEFENATAREKRGNFSLDKDGTISFCGRVVSGLLSASENILLTGLIRHGSVTLGILRKSYKESYGAAYPHHSTDVHRYLAAKVRKIQKNIRDAHPDLPDPGIKPNGRWNQRNKGYYIDETAADYRYVPLTTVPDCFGHFNQAAEARRNAFSFKGDAVFYHDQSIENILTPGEKRFLKGMILSEQGVTPYTINQAYEKATGKEHPYHPLSVLNTLRIYATNIREKLREHFPDHPEPDIKPYSPALSSGEKGAYIPQIHQGYFLPGDAAPAPKT